MLALNTLEGKTERVKYFRIRFEALEARMRDGRKYPVVTPAK